MERYLFLILAIIGGGAVYYDMSLLNNWIGPTIIAAPLVAFALSFMPSGKKGDGYEEAVKTDAMPAAKGDKGGQDKDMAEDTDEDAVKDRAEDKAATVAREENARDTTAQQTLMDDSPADIALSKEDIELHADSYRKEGVVWMLALLQREGRFIDFIQEDISSYDDSQVGAAVRQMHDNIKKAINDVIEVGVIIDAEEGTKIEIDEDYDPSKIRLTGNIKGKPPFTGSLMHPGWAVKAIRVPKILRKEDVIYEAEVEV